MNTAAIAGVPLTPAAVADEKGNVVVMAAAAGPAAVERLLRVVCDELGGSVGLAASPMEGATVKRVGCMWGGCGEAVGRLLGGAVHCCRRHASCCAVL
jgi:DUF917 family protein